MVSTQVLSFSLTNLQAVQVNDTDKIVELQDGIITELEYTSLGSKQHTFSPHGFTRVVLLSESHISVHTWPEEGLIIFELLSCKAISEQAILEVTKLIQEEYPQATIKYTHIPIT